MNTESLATVSQAAFDQAEATVITLMREAYPSLDLRKGTVLRELVVRPAAAWYALESDRYAYLQSVRSLQAIAENPTVATDEDVNHILSNFLLTKRTGASAVGLAKITVAYDQLYYVPSSFQLQTDAGQLFTAQQAYSALSEPREGFLRLYPAADGRTWYFLLPVIAAAPGAASAIAGGTALSAVSGFDGFIAAEANGTFTGGVDPETVEQLIARLPAAVSHRSLESRRSIEAILRSEEHGGFGQELVAVSIQGMGDRTQLRDKHNAAGVAMGGRVDIYPRTFQRPTVVALRKTGTLVAPNTYTFAIDPGDAPGFYAIRAVMDPADLTVPETSFSGFPAIGSYLAAEAREGADLQTTPHDIEGAVEAAYTVWQRSFVTVTGVTGTGTTREFRVELYVAPKLADIQAYVDESPVRNLKADYVVRCPLMCLVGVRARVTLKAGVTVSVPAMQEALSDYINSRSFVGQLTESELLAVLHAFPILRVDTTDNPVTGFRLTGLIRGADGAARTLSGHALDIEAVADPKALLAPETCVFVSDPADIHITTVTEAP